jgi:hypothetical protein
VGEVVCRGKKCLMLLCIFGCAGRFFSREILDDMMLASIATAMNHQYALAAQVAAGGKSGTRQPHRSRREQRC